MKKNNHPTRMHERNYITTALSSVLLLAITSVNLAHAQYNATPKNWEQKVNVSNSSLYYKLGGAQALSKPAGSLTINAKLGLSGGLGFSYSCGKFTGIAGLKATATAKLEEYKAVASQVAANAIAALPMYILSRAAPDLYDNFQAIVSQAQAELAAAFKTCEEMEREIAQGKDPYAEYARMAQFENWKVEASKGESSGGGSIYSIKVKMREDGGKNGVTWLGGDKKGGRGQEPIRVVKDTVTAGYLQTTNQSPSAPFFRSGGSSASSNPNYKLAQHFPTSNDAANFAIDVLGDIEVGTCDVADGCPPKNSIAGLGLLPQIQKENDLASQQLRDLILPNRPADNYTLSNLQQVSAPGMAITREVIDALRSMKPDESAMAGGRLAQEVAQIRVMDRALILRNLLMTGLQTPDIRSNEAANKDIKDKLADLNRYIEDTLFEIRARKEVVSNTAETLVQYHRARQAAASAIPTSGVTDNNTMNNGALRKNP